MSSMIIANKQLKPISKFLSLPLAGGLFVCLLLFIGGCGSETERFFEKDHIQIHSKELLREFEEVGEITTLDNPMPEIYLQPPKIIQTKSRGVKLFYFTKNLSPKTLSSLVATQLGYKTSQNPEANQLIIECPDEAAAEEAIAVLEAADVPPIQIQIDCLISELTADLTLDYETSLEISNLANVQVTPFDAVSDVIDLLALGDTNIVTGESTGKPTFPGAASRAGGRRNSGLKIGLQDSTYNPVTKQYESNFKAVVDVLISRGYLKILMHPTLRVINGQKAVIKTSDSVPVQVVSKTTQNEIVDSTIYKDVIDSLEVVPFAYADGSVSLSTKATISSRSAPEGVTQNTIFTTREVNVAENRIRPGGSMVIGGIRKSEQLGIVRGVPFLKDIPILGVFFSSKDEEQRGREILFIITPTIADTGVEFEEMAARIERKHARPEIDRGLVKTMTDPLGQSAYTEHVEQKARVAESEMIRAELKAEKAFEEALRAETEAMTHRDEAMKALEDAERARQQAAAAQAKLQQAMAEMEKLKTQSQQTQAEADKIRAEAEKARAQAQAAAAQAQKAEEEKQKALQSAQQAQAQAEKIKAEADKARAEAEAAKAAEAQAQQEAERQKQEADKLRNEQQQNEQPEIDGETGSDGVPR